MSRIKGSKRLDERESILIVDDDEGTRRALNLIFSKRNYETETAGTGKEAIEKLKNRFFNITLLDIKLPDIEGIELLTPIKKLQPDMDVMMITAYASIDVAVRALNEGASAFITKPLNMEEVLATIKNTLEKQRLFFEKNQAEVKLKESEIKYHEAYDRVEFFKTLFAHDISNILQNIQTSAGLISLWQKDTKKRDKIDKLIETINDQVIRGSNLISNVRKLSQLDQTSEKLRPIEVILTLKKTIEFIHQTYVYKEIDIQSDFAINECNVKANEFLLDIFENILFNAVKHNENHKIKIIIQISKQDIEGRPFLRIEFIDNGVGIPDEMKEKIFIGVFHKERNIKGMGLGLLLITKILNLFDGKIYIEDRVKGDYTKGSNFVIFLPEVT